MTMARGFAKIALPAATLLLAGCSIGPKYVKPSVPAVPAYKELGASNVAREWKPAEPADRASRGKWWESFQDPELNRLEEQLNISNQNIAAAAANVQAARALIRQARSQYFPTLGANPSISNSRISSAFGQTVGVNYSLYTLPLEASWEPDLWGRVRKTVASNTFAAQSAAADLENVRLSAQSDLATDYYELRAQDALRQVLDSTLSAYTETLELTRDLYRAGLDSDEAVAQAESQLKATQAQDTNVGVLRSQYEHAIAVLAGDPASTFSISARVVSANPPAIPLGLPSQLLERRPDIAAAERLVAQANAQIGIAKTAYYPNITLSGDIGLESVAIAKWLAWPSRIWSVGPSLAQTIFDAGLRRAAVQQYQATYDQTVANYRQTVLIAFQQVEDNLAALRILAQVIGQQNEAIDAAGRNLAEAEVRYKAGLDPYLNVIVAQTALLSDQQAVVNFREQQMVAAVQLVKAVGGGWDASQIPSMTGSLR
jgi:NodT family efflux transporter outer membrane factor (OMF) lipoprotein